MTPYIYIANDNYIYQINTQPGCELSFTLYLSGSIKPSVLVLCLVVSRPKCCVVEKVFTCTYSLFKSKDKFLSVLLSAVALWGAKASPNSSFTGKYNPITVDDSVWISRCVVFLAAGTNIVVGERTIRRC